MPGVAYIGLTHYSLRMDVNDAVLIGRLQKRDEAAFEQVFKANYKNLHGYAFIMLRDEMTAEEIVQNVFFKLWERNENISISGSVTAYLYRAVYNEALNYLKHLKVRSKHRLYVAHHINHQTNYASKNIQLKELEEKLQISLKELPEQCRTIFQMSRFEELRYQEIADKLNISIKTVEGQIGKALKILRAKLADFMVLIFFLFLYI